MVTDLLRGEFEVNPGSRTKNKRHDAYTYLPLSPINAAAVITHQVSGKRKRYARSSRLKTSLTLDSLKEKMIKMNPRNKLVSGEII